MHSKVIVTCAVTGAGDTPGKSPHVPVTPQQIATSCLEAAAAGAAIVHIHVRDPKSGAPSRDDSLYAEVVERIRASNSELILNLTGGMGGDLLLGDADPLAYGKTTDCVSADGRITHSLKLAPDIGSLDIGVLNFDEVIYATKPSYSRQIAQAYQAAGIRPEIEAFELGHIELTKQLIAEGVLAERALFQLCLGIKYGAPATVDAMKAMRDALPPGAMWSAFGVGRQQFPMVAAAVLLGGHVRVGLEDNLYLEKGVLATNAQLVEKAVSIVRLLGASVMSAQEARSYLALSRSGTPGLRKSLA
jgi:uncharacterized protein (DUF849 family)